MTDDVEERIRRRQLKFGWTALAIVLLAVAAGLVVVVLEHQDDKYGPIEAGGFGGVGGQRHVVHEDGKPARLTTAGSQTAFYYATLGNLGEHSVKITGIDTDDVNVKAQWAPLPAKDNSTDFDEHAAWRDFPAVVGDQLIQVRYEIRRPTHCQDQPITPGSGEFYNDRHTVRWESLLGDHTSVVGNDPFGRELQLC